MFCMKCQKELSDCTCTDIVERLNSLRDCSNLDTETCINLPLKQIAERKAAKRLEYISIREALIPLAEEYADRIAGQRPPFGNTRRHNKLKEVWDGTWSKAFHSRMEELYEEAIALKQ